jgi:AraC-like DNA-binding protein
MEYIGICANERIDPTPEADGYAAHSHDSYEIFLPVAGSLAFDVEAYRYTVERGSVLILPPFVSHRLIVQDSEPLEYLYAQFSPKAMPDEEDLKETVESLFHGYGEGEMSMRHLPKESFAFVHGAIKRLCVSGTKEVHHQFFRILSPLLREILLYGIPVNGKQGELAKKGSRKTALTDQIIDYVSLHYADIQDLSFVVDVFHYSTVHVNSLFKNRLGVSLWRYVLHIRLDRACDMLVNGIHASEVALSCGFKDYSTFYRLFKKSYGITPTECRRTGKKPKMIS